MNTYLPIMNTTSKRRETAAIIMMMPAVLFDPLMTVIEGASEYLFCVIVLVLVRV